MHCDKLTYVAARHRGHLYELGLYPAAVKEPDGRVGEVYRRRADDCSARWIHWGYARRSDKLYARNARNHLRRLAVRLGYFYNARWDGPRMLRRLSSH